MLISEKLKEREFTGKTAKQAYMSCCKWLASNVIAVNNSKNITMSIEKVNTNKVKLTLYVSVDEGEIKNRHCDICKEVTSSFFMTENKYMCESCKLIPYRKRIKDKLNLVKQGLKGVIE